MLNPTDNPKFSTCTVTYYEADKPTPSEGTKAKCEGSNTDCNTDCASPLTITELANGKPYTIVIAAASTAGISNGFKEHIFIRTGKKFIIRRTENSILIINI